MKLIIDTLQHYISDLLWSARGFGRGDMHIHTSDQEKLNMGFNDYTCNWGLHICGLYENEQERDQIILNFLAEGSRAGDLQLYCPVERSKEDFEEKISGMCPECASKLHDPDVFQVRSAREIYYPNGTFSPREMDKNLGALFEESQLKGPRNVRATAEMAWALDAVPGREFLFVYESRLNYFIPGKPWISICMYNLKRFDGATIMDVLRTHPFTIGKGVITENPFFVHPDKWLAENAPEYLY